MGIVQKIGLWSCWQQVYEHNWNLSKKMGHKIILNFEKKTALPISARRQGIVLIIKNKRTWNLVDFSFQKTIE